MQLKDVPSTYPKLPIVMGKACRKLVTCSFGEGVGVPKNSFLMKLF